ncbi:TIM barrel protein [Rhodocytophaga aerolata]|uniref:TIM barrel protein n=1 Tax=Rhodocytophaga aerolata TaxID=455078 RepID=A0ABT8R992_9BACT|nr:TIM barrel protein [Rhodocytophaga aerolata]MDO1448655.1 TIM barrel protein [Rhodocytophaga aerolata]
MQLGISTYTYGWAVGTPENRPSTYLTELDLLTKAEQVGVSLVQVGDNLPLHQLPAQSLRTFSQEAQAKNISLEIGARGLTEDHLHLYIRIARQLNARLLRFVVDAKDYEPNVDTIISIIKVLLPQLENTQLTLGLENHDRLKAKEFAYIIEQVGSPFVGICLDSVNSMGAGEGLEQVVEILAPYTVNVHIKDFGIKRLPHLMGFQIDGRPAGKGMLNVPWLLEKLIPYQRCHTAILEQWVVPEDTLEKSIGKEDAWATESIQYLKPYFT